MDYTVESIGRDFGTVLLDMPAGGDGLHAGLQAARAGWVRVRQLLVNFRCSDAHWSVVTQCSFWRVVPCPASHESGLGQGTRNILALRLHMLVSVCSLKTLKINNNTMARQIVSAPAVCSLRSLKCMCDCGAGAWQQRRKVAGSRH